MSLLPYVCKRLLWMVPSLLGITLVTFLAMDLAPSSRAEIAIDGDPAAVAHTDDEHRAAQIRRLRAHWDLLDESGEMRPAWDRYLRWLQRASTLRLAGPGEDAGRFRDRILQALPVSLLVNGLALLVSLGIAIPLGARLGMRRSGVTDRVTSGAMLFAFAMPEFLLATLLVILLGGGLFEPVFPIRGLVSDESASGSIWTQALDLAAHLALPVTTLAIAPTVVITRFLRDSVARAARSDFIAAMRAWGLPERTIRKRALHHGISPIVTLIGILLPSLMGGSVVVETTFSLPGLGRLAFDAAMRQEHSMVMAMTLLISVATLVSLLVSDILHRVVDPRVELR